MAFGLIQPEMDAHGALSCVDSTDEEQMVQQKVQQLNGLMQRLQHRRGFTKALPKVREVVQQLQALAKENSRLKNRLAGVQAGLQLASLEEQWHRLSGTDPRWRPMGHGGLGPATSMVSIHHLPHPDGWTSDWTERVRQMNTHDLLNLHKQWLLAGAVRLPRVELAGPGSPEYNELVNINERYSCFNQRAMDLIPETWRARSFYDLETMQPIQRPSKQWFIDFFSSRKSPGAVIECFKEYATASRALQAQYVDLERQCEQLLAKHPSLQLPRSFKRDCYSLQAFSAHTRSAMPASDNMQTYCELECLLQQMDSNLRKQRMRLKHCLFAAWASFRQRAPDMHRSYLLMWPLPLDFIDFLEMLSESPTPGDLNRLSQAAIACAPPGGTPG